jgi:hypothetical protein
MNVRHRSLRRAALASLLPCALFAALPAVSIAKRAVKHEQTARTPANKVVSACLHKARLTHVTSSAGQLWVGWDPKVYGFVYVQKYANVHEALSEAEFIKAEESGVAGRLAVSQHIAPYKGSPVPGIVKCLGGRMVSKSPKKNPGKFTF